MRPQFVLIDHSLQNLGGHHYPYAFSVLQAAQRAGWQPVLATHRSFRDQAALPADWQILPTFRYPSYSRYSFNTQSPASAGSVRSWWSGARAWLAARGRARQSAAFAAGCGALLAKIALNEHDLLFIGTCSELDLQGLSALLQRDAGARRLNWHLQFHFGVFRGREPDYAAQHAAAAQMRSVLAAALRPLAGCRLHCYCTTRQLTAQYLRLGVGDFTTLPYPVHELFSAARAGARHNACARIACLGHSRREKGYGQLTGLLRELWPQWLGTGRAQLLLQTHHRRQRRSLRRAARQLGAGSAAAGGALQFADFPLALEQYAQLLRSADIGLMLYDSETYYARCSGVLLEMLAAGVPVLVPAGCWLAEQLNEPNQLYLEALAARPESLQATTLSLHSSDEAAGPNAGVATFSAQAGAIDCTLDPATSALLLEFRWLSPEEPGSYLRLELEQRAASTARASGSRAVVGQRTGGKLVRAMLRVPPGSTRVRINCRNAWATGALRIAGLRCLAWRGPPPPLGAVGLTYADAEQVGELLDELLSSLPHYRATAARHALECAPLHSADRVIAALVARPARDAASA
jgi:hypothetical protein